MKNKISTRELHALVRHNAIPYLVSLWNKAENARLMAMSPFQDGTYDVVKSLKWQLRWIRISGIVFLLSVTMAIMASRGVFRSNDLEMGLGGLGFVMSFLSSITLVASLSMYVFHPFKGDVNEAWPYLGKIPGEMFTRDSKIESEMNRTLINMAEEVAKTWDRAPFSEREKELRASFSGAQQAFLRFGAVDNDPKVYTHPDQNNPPVPKNNKPAKPASASTKSTPSLTASTSASPAPA